MEFAITVCEYAARSTLACLVMVIVLLACYVALCEIFRKD